PPLTWRGRELPVESPVPSSPLTFLPQQKAALSTATAHGKYPPGATDRTVPPVTLRCGVSATRPAEAITPPTPAATPRRVTTESAGLGNDRAESRGDTLKW